MTESTRCLYFTLRRHDRYFVSYIQDTANRVLVPKINIYSSVKHLFIGEKRHY